MNMEQIIKEPINACYITEFLRHAWTYIKARRPYELMTLAILNEKMFDISDVADGEERNRRIN
jgi:hypothetical protein